MVKTESRSSTLTAILRGAVAAIGVTLAGMLLLAAAVVWLGLTDGALLTLNQVLKLLSIFFGVWAAVGWGGRRGFALGAAVGLIYMVLGYAIYCIFDGVMASMGTMASEFALGALVGALSGALLANMRPRTRRSARA